MVYTLETLVKSDKKTLEEVMKNGLMPDLESLADWEFDGYGPTPLSAILGLRKFRKGFYKEKDKYKGYNVKMKQNKFEEPWECKHEKPKVFGWFDIMTDYSHTNVKPLYPNAALIHYGFDERNTLLDGKIIRDFLVQVNKDDKDLYLGKAYSAIGKKLMTPVYFIIKRGKKSSL